VTVRNTQNQPLAPSLDERIKWAAARVIDAERLLNTAPTSRLFYAALLARKAELAALERCRRAG
jgi:hypothetical protein